MKCQQCGKDVRVPANCTGVVCRECKSSITVPIRIKPSNGMFLKSEWIDAELDGREVRMANIVNAPAVWLEIDGRSYVADLTPLLHALLEQTPEDSSLKKFDTVAENSSPERPANSQAKRPE